MAARCARAAVEHRSTLEPRFQRNIAVLGATGSIGTSALDVIARHPDRLRASVLAAGSNVDALLALCRDAPAGHAVIADESALRRACATACAMPAWTRRRMRATAALDTTRRQRCLRHGRRRDRRRRRPAVDAGRRARRQAPAAGEQGIPGPGRRTADRRRARRRRRLMPIDSEHNAIFQCLPDARRARSGLRRILLTASGGPFRGRTPRRNCADVTPAQAVAHPKWSMGPKISVDSATLMNKGLEVIEAHHLFGAAGRAHRRAGASAEPGAFAGRIRRRLDAGAARPAGHAHRAGGRLRLARSGSNPASPGSTCWRMGGWISKRRTCDAFPCLRLAYRRARSRRHRAGGAQCRQRSRCCGLPAGRIGFLRIPGAGRGHARRACRPCRPIRSTRCSTPMRVRGGMSTQPSAVRRPSVIRQAPLVHEHG